MKIQTMISLVLLLPCWLAGQADGPSAVSAGGGTAAGEAMILEWTLGELAISTIQHNKGLLTEGVHQPILETEIIDASVLPPAIQGVSKTVPSLTFTAAPNPVASELQVRLASGVHQEGTLELISPAGQRLAHYAVMMDYHSATIEMSTYPSGTYFLLLRDGQGQILKTVKVIKLR